MIDPARPRPQRSMPPTRRGEGMTGSRLSGLPSGISPDHGDDDRTQPDRPSPEARTPNSAQHG